jgi:glycosyltransferase involved in cell wall biosynthesis
VTGPAVVVCTDPGVPVFGHKGASVHCQQVLRELVRRFLRVHLITCRPGGTPPPGLRTVVVHELPRPAGDDHAARELAVAGLDAVVVGVLDAIAAAEGAPALVYQRYGLWSCGPLEHAREQGWPSVLEVNAPLPEEQARHRRLTDHESAVRLTQRAFRAADLVYAVSRPVADWVERLCPGRQVPVVPNGVDPAAFPAPAGRTAGDVLVFAGTFRPWHGVDLLVEAAGRMVRDPQDRGTSLLLVGDGPALPRAVERAVQLGVPVRATGAVAPDEVPALLAGADVGVAPYPAGEHYFSPLKVAEYLAAGLATVAADVAGLSDHVAHGREALLVPPGDLAALTTALRDVRDDPRLRARLGRAGRQAAERMSWRSVVDRVLDLLVASERVAGSERLTAPGWATAPEWVTAQGRVAGAGTPR